MRDYIEIGPSPADEDCEQVGPNCDYGRMKKECRALINQLRRMHGDEPEGASLRVKGNPHDFGTYYEVACYFDSELPQSVEYALKCEDLPETWDDEARKELGLS
jgi:hypothetical protein